MVSESYEVVVGLNYGDKRANTGDIVDDLPKEAIPGLLAADVIRKVEKPKRTKKDEAVEAESPEEK